MKNLEILTYTNDLGESVIISNTTNFCPQEITGLADVRNTIYSINCMGQDGDTFVANCLESRDIDILGFIMKGPRSHAWLEKDGLIVDITGDQFPGGVRIYVGTKNASASITELF